MDLAELNARHDRWTARVQALEAEYQQYRAELEADRQLANNTRQAIALLQFVAKETAQDDEQKAAVLATLALQETFDDEVLSLKVTHQVIRNHPGVTFTLRDEIRDAEGDPIDSFGGGPAALIGLILQVISVVRQPGMARVLILDEPFTQISEGYQDAAGKLLRKLCDPPPRGLNFKMLVITHLNSIAAAAHTRYKATKSEDGRSLVLTKDT
jgi:hypothetical protein